MKNFLSCLCLGLVAGLLASCTHSTHVRGSVALKHSETEADVCLGKNEVSAGDEVILFKSVCRPRIRGREGTDAPSCHKHKLGEGKVLQVLDEHYSVIGVSPGVDFGEGTIVERK